MAGDVMTGRGIDQILPHPSDPTIYEPYLKDARRYLEIAEETNGPIPRPVDFSYVWGDVLAELKRILPDAKIINLETSVTKSDNYWKGKGINYRMHPANMPCITVAGIDICSLANNHVLDWGYEGLEETLETLKKAKVRTAGAGRTLAEAEQPAVLHVEGKGRVIVYAFAFVSSGVLPEWAATRDGPGVNLLKDLSDTTLLHLSPVTFRKQVGDIVVASIHWGGNWGYAILQEERAFAHMLIDEAGVDVIHGHSSHHVKGIEIHKEKLIIYGCGDFLNDYEGISGYEAFRADLGLMYFAHVNPVSGRLISLNMMPTQIRRFRVNRASRDDAAWLRDILNREGAQFGTRVHLNEDNSLALERDERRSS